ncbi:aromatic amino acid transaminase [Nitratireductor sp.]|uniref:aromatic amino acid transaminase n=1 Tax=Nitratireductor sp. TaxID=1872084 RepID=UPI0025E65645|nr:aromatic amino acid transaminase [Nitratireductor sp.]
MLNAITPTPTDPLWALTGRFKADPRPEKLDLLIGVYRDESGETPVMEAVHQAEMHWARGRVSKTYPPLAGHETFNQLMSRQLLGTPALIERAVTQQTVGGTGALRLLADLIAHLRSDVTIWVSDPGYVNHEPIFRAAGLKVQKFPYRQVGGDLDVAAMLNGLEGAHQGDVLVLHACCHNPSGIDMPPELWSSLSGLCRKKGIVPLIDSAYHGLGDGLEADLAGLRYMAETVGEVLVAASCSKNMGLYSERVGCATILREKPGAADDVRGVLQGLARRSYSMPPYHGASLAAMVMEDEALRESWLLELEEMRLRIVGNRRALAEAFLNRTNRADLIAVGKQKGMFSILPLNTDQMMRLREGFGIYGTDFGRINIAGMSSSDADRVADAVLAVMSNMEPPG